MPAFDPSTDPDARGVELARQADLASVARALTKQRSVILDGWLRAARAQPFHAGAPVGAVADHMPALLDAVIDVLARSAPRWVEPDPPAQDSQIVAAARSHARARFLQGFEAADLVTEFRLLRQEVGRALRTSLADRAPLSDVLAAELLVHDALDSAIGLALTTLTDHIEEVRQDFLATTLHDVQQPLSTIKGRAQLALRRLERSGSTDASAMESLRVVACEADRTVRMLAALADASRLALGKFDLRRTSVDIVALVHEVASRLEPEIVTRLNIAAPGPIVGRWDRDLLERVIDNALSNAIKYSPPATRIDVQLQSIGAAALVTIHDQGIGLAANEVNMVFERYRRGRGAVDRGIRGQGLGLYLSRSVVEAHAGEMWLESPGPGFGATLCVRLPFDAAT